MAYSADTFVADEQPTTAKWNKLWSNDASFNDGTGIADNAIINRHMADDSVTGDNLSLDTVQATLASNFATSSTTFVDASLKVTLAAAGTWLVMADLRALVASAGQFGISQLYNFTTSTAVTDSERLSPYGAGSSERLTAPLTRLVTTTTTNNSVGIQYKSGGAYTATLESDNNGRSTILALRVG